MHPPIERFLRDIDALWVPLRAGKQPLHLIGSGALMLQSDYRRSTKDGDVLQTSQLDPSAAAQLLALAGRNTELCGQHRMYIDVVRNALPFLAQRPRWHELAQLNAALIHFELYVLDVVDVVVSKLKRFHGDDQADVLAMIERNLVDHATLVARFEAAKDWWQDGAQAEDLPRYVENLHRVERDYLAVDESDIELPSWVAD